MKIWQQYIKYKTDFRRASFSGLDKRGSVSTWYVCMIKEQVGLNNCYFRFFIFESVVLMFELTVHFHY